MTQKQTKEKLDKHYTNVDVSKKLVSLINQDDYDHIIEPSAGDGSICNFIDASKLIALDIAPENDDVIKKMDFFDFDMRPKDGQKILTIGNPPFGFRAQLAIEFFNHAAKYSDTIAFILPRSFKKAYIINQLDTRFHLDQQLNVDIGSFVSGTNARCCIQVWKKDFFPRKKIILPKHSSDFQVIPQGNKFDINNTNYAIRRTGYSNRVGELIESSYATPITQFIFLKVDSDIIVSKLKKLNHLLYKYSYDTTAISPTFTIGEFIQLYEDNKDNL